jgi:hypothetical protein
MSISPCWLARRSFRVCSGSWLSGPLQTPAGAVAHGADHRRARVSGSLTAASRSRHQATTLTGGAHAVLVVLALVLVGPCQGAGPVTGLAPRRTHDRGLVAQDARCELLGCCPSPLPELGGHRVLRDRTVGLPPGGLHPIGADHCPEREPSRAWSAGLRRCFGRADASRRRGMWECGWAAKGSWNP